MTEMDTHAEIEAAVSDLMPSLAAGEPVLWDCGSREIAVAMHDAVHARLRSDAIRVRHDSGIIDLGGNHYLQALNLGKLQLKSIVAAMPAVH